MNARRLVSTANLTREEWLKFRRMGIGGSDAPAICGLSRWGNPLSVYVEKVSTKEPDEEESRFMYWGTRLEPVIADEFSKQTGLKVRQCNYILQHQEHDWMLANIDREVIDPERGRIGLECKNASQYKAKEWQDGLTPEEYIVQCSHYMMVTGAPCWYLAVLIGGNDFVWRLLERDMDLEQHLFRHESEFWQMVQAQTPPAIGEDGGMVGMEFMPQDDRVILPGVLIPKLTRFKELDAQIKPLEKEVKGIKDLLHHIMEVADPNCEAFACGDFQLSRKIVPTKKFDLQAFKTEQPELFDGYQTTAVQRRLTIK